LDTLMTSEQAGVETKERSGLELNAPAGFRESILRTIFPSARDIIFIFLLWSLLAGTLSNRPLADADIGWHIRTGEQILATHTLPRVDSYSSTMQGQPWFAWEWLYDVMLGILYRACGLNGVVWLCAVLVATTFTILLSQLIKRGTGMLLAIGLMLLAEAAATVHLFARPHIVSWLFSLLWFVALERWESGAAAPRWMLWFFPATTLLWVNLHGGWLVGLAMVAIYALAAFIESVREEDAFAAVRAARRARAMGLAFVASAVATLVNPYGWRLHAHIYHYLGDRYLMNRIAEFRSPDFHGWAQRCFLIILVLTLMAWAGARGRVRISHLLMAMFATYVGLISTRNLPVSSMILVLIIGPRLWGNFVGLANRPGGWMRMRTSVSRVVEFSGRVGAQELGLRGHLWPAVCVIGALVICLHGGWIGSHQVIHAQFDPKALPVAAADFLAGEQSATPVFSPDAWGGYVIYRLYPQRLVVVDDRHDLYGSARFRDILTVLQGEPGWRGLIEKLQVRTAVLPADSTLSSLLRELPLEWNVVYEDKVAVVFEKKL
jgi:hypothetical protein